MAAGAANDEELMAQLGEATAREARMIGINWVLTPDIDLNYNFNNPVTTIRALRDKPDLVGRLATVLIQALQMHGVAATAKHFPGDGMDDRDQHLVTSINTSPLTSGGRDGLGLCAGDCAPAGAKSAMSDMTTVAMAH